MKARITIDRRWGAKWEQRNRLDGHRALIIGGCNKLFKTKRECHAWIKQEYSYIAKRPDLRKEPHCWRVPKPVRVAVEVREVR